MTNGRVNRSLVTPRLRGGVTGLALILLGAWGAVVPFVGPYFNYAYTPNSTWTWTASRGWLEVLPGAVVFVAGLILVGSTHRVRALLAGWLAACAGAWFIVGPLLSPIWRSGYIGTPTGGTTRVSLEQIGIFYGLGGAIILFAAFALGRFSVVGVRDVAYAERRASRVTSAEPVEPVAEAPVQPVYTAPAEAPATAVDDDGDRRSVAAGSVATDDSDLREGDDRLD